MQFIPFEGAIPACLLPFHEDYTIDEDTYARHLRYLADTPGVQAITINGHAGENNFLSDEERRRSVRIARKAVGGRVAIICGVMKNGTAEAAREACMAREEGADGLLIFPSDAFTAGGAAEHPDMVYQHFSAIAEAAGLPMILFAFAAATDMRYPIPVVKRIVRDIPNVVSIKNVSYDIAYHEALYEELRSLGKRVTLLSSFSKTLLSSLAVCADGLLSGNGSIIPEYHAGLLDAMRRGNLARAREIWAQILPVVTACYAPPMTDMHNRMKYIAMRLGRFPTCTVRPPLLPLSQAERERLDQAILAAGLR